MLMNNLLDDPDNLFELARLYPVSVATSLVYGHRAKDLNSFWYKDFFHMMEQVSVSSSKPLAIEQLLTLRLGIRSGQKS